MQNGTAYLENNLTVSYTFKVYKVYIYNNPVHLVLGTQQKLKFCL